MTDINTFDEKFEALRKKSDSVSFLKDETQKSLDSLSNKIAALEDDISLLDKVSNLFKHLLDTLLEEKKNDVESLVTYGLKTVFEDQDLKFHIEINPKYNSIHTSFTTEHVGVAKGDVIENFGGGVVNLESFLLRVITLFQSKLNPVLFLDECFNNLSEEYVENCSLLLRGLCEQMGLTLFLVTHQPVMLTNAHKVYKASSRSNKLVLNEK